MSEEHVFPVRPEIAKSAWCDNDKYLTMYKQSIEDPAAFWGEHGKRIDWFKPYTKVKDVSLKAPDVHIRWFADGNTNVSYNCLDRHLASRGDQTALLWEGDDPAESKAITYQQLHERGLQVRQRAQGRGRQEGRPGLDLPADDPGAADRHAGLRPHRRHPLDRLRRLLARQPGRPHPGLRRLRASSPPTRALRGGRKVGAEGQRRRGAERRARRSTRVHRRHAAPAARSTGMDGRDHWWHDD